MKPGGIHRSLNRDFTADFHADVSVDGPRVFYVVKDQIFAATDPAPTFIGSDCSGLAMPTSRT